MNASFSVASVRIVSTDDLHVSLSHTIGEPMGGEPVNVGVALTAVVHAYHLPQDAPLIIFALARTVRWLAHAMEQATSGRLIRPRARYVGPPVQ